MFISSIAEKPFALVTRKSIDGILITMLFLLGFIFVVLTYLSFIDLFRFLSTSELLKCDLIIFLCIVLLLSRRIFLIFHTQKKDISTSGLHMKLVFLFSIVSLFPAAFMAFFSIFFFHYGLQTWFSEQIKTAIVESNTIAESYLAEHQNTIRADILAMANDLDRQYDVLSDSNLVLKKMIDTQVFYRNLSDALIIGDNQQILVHSGLKTTKISSVPNHAIDAAQNGEVVMLTNHDDDRVRALVKLNRFDNSFLLVERPVDATVLSRVQQTRVASEKYTSLEDQSAQIRVTLIFIYIVLSVFLVLLSIWFALKIAQKFISPIDRLIEASNRVSSGDLTLEIKEKAGVSELDLLTKAYNEMTAQLSKQRHELISANKELDERRIFTETVLAGTSSGILSVDYMGYIQLYNASAKAILNWEDKQSLIGQKISDILPEITSLLETILSDEEEKNSKIELEIPSLIEKANRKDLFLRAIPEMIDGKTVGAIITFDDITNLKSAQRSAAWSDVARRIAHEIKNPLTPIQLSADRIRKKFSKDIPEKDRNIFETCIETISRHVDDIGAMVSEFSSFARMPEAKISKTNLSELIQQCVILHRQIDPNIKIDLRGLLKRKPPVYAYIDEQLIRQAFINLLQNSLDAVTSNQKDSKKKIDVWLHKHEEHIFLIVHDSGAGFPLSKDIETLLDPYVTQKKNGTGLGLAIVKKIMAEHSGEIRLGSLPWMPDIKDWEELDGAIVSLIFPSFYTKDDKRKLDE